MLEGIVGEAVLQDLVLHRGMRHGGHVAHKAGGHVLQRALAGAMRLQDLLEPLGLPAMGSPTGMGRAAVRNPSLYSSALTVRKSSKLSG